MRIATIFEYLVGRRRAILEIASDRRALGVAALLVLSAALARNYDRVSLLHEPWRLLGPFVASLAISGPLFLFLYGPARWKGMEGPGIGRAYLTFLSLYWMMAPMAWLYGIPYERFLSPVEAVSFNLHTLALVSVWRVALMARVVSVLFGLPVWAALSLVALVADVASLTALHLVPLPVIGVMGGVSPENEVVAIAALLVKALGWLTLPVWVVLAGIVTFSSSSRYIPEWRAPSMPGSSGRHRGALVFAGLAAVAWAVLLPFTQPEQLLARQVARAYQQDGASAAISLMSAHRRADFPPDWQPPPRPYPHDPPTSEVLDTLEALADRHQADWVAEAYIRRFLDRARYDSFSWPNDLLEHHAIRLATILPRLAQGAEMARALRDANYGSIEQWLDSYHVITKDHRAALEVLLRLAGPEKSEPLPKPTTSKPNE